MPTSCSNNVVCPSPDSPTTAGNVPDALSSNLVAKGVGYTVASIHVVLASVPTYQTVPVLALLSP